MSTVLLIFKQRHVTHYDFIVYRYLASKFKPPFTCLQGTPQPAQDVKMTSYKCRCNVMTSYRRRYDVILAPFVHCVKMYHLHVPGMPLHVVCDCIAKYTRVSNDRL